MLGDILKVVSWPMGFIILAAGRGGIFIGTELTWCAAYLGSILLGMPEFGLATVGVGFWFAYLIYCGVVAIVAINLIRFRLARRNWLFTLILLLAGGLIMLLSDQSATAGYVSGLMTTLLISVYSLRRLDSLVDLRGMLQRKFTS